MKVRRFHTNLRHAPSQRGQTFMIIMMFIGLFLLAILGVAVDYSQVWAHRQMAQGAADAACEAGAADLFLKAIDPNASGQGGLQPFTWIGNPYDCTASSTDPVCSYAALNGYVPSSTVSVHVTFPTSLPGVTPLPASLATTNPYIQVTVTDTVAMSFTKMLPGTASSIAVKATAGCGVAPVAVPVPLVVLHQTAAQSLSTQGSGGIQILGGPARSIQVDSNSTAAVNVGGSATVDLSLAGPSGTGGDFGVFGRESEPGGVSLGSGHWISPASPLGDPWATYSEPPLPSATGKSRPVAFGTSGCPDPTGCVEFTAGDYSGQVAGTNCATGTVFYVNVNSEPNGCLILPITLKINDRKVGQPYNTAGEVILPTNNNPGNFAYKVTTTGTTANTNNNKFPASGNWNQTAGGTQTDGTVTWTNIGALPSGSRATAIFDPGIYYVGVEGLQLGSGSTVRPSTATGDGTAGPMFFFSQSPGSGKNLGTVTVDSNSGSASACTSVTPASPNGCVVSYKLDGTANLGVTSRALACSGGTNPGGLPSSGLIDGNVLLGPCTGTYGSSDGKNRGFIFFQKRSTAVSANWGGSAGSLVSGFMYFHNTGYASQISMSGGSNSAALALGNIVSDKITLGGGSGIKMILNAQVTFQVLKPTLLQ